MATFLCAFWHTAVSWHFVLDNYTVSRSVIELNWTKLNICCAWIKRSRHFDSLFCLQLKPSVASLASFPCWNQSQSGAPSAIMKVVYEGCRNLEIFLHLSYMFFWWRQRQKGLTTRGNSQKMTSPQTQPEWSAVGPSYKIVGLSTIDWTVFFNEFFPPEA